MSSTETEQALLSPAAAKIFISVGTVWLLCAAGLVCYFAPAGSAIQPFILWLLILWSLSMGDLFALAKAAAATFALMGSEGEKRGALIIQASYWGAIKLGFLGLFGLILFKADGAPSLALFLGMGTLVVVPLISGYFWSQRILRHA